MPNMFLGIDTSCYTTSVAVVDENGAIVDDRRIMLPVASGEHGLRQSDAIFHHVRHLAELFANQLPPGIKAIAVSSKPRPLPDSYMPVFLAGLAIARSMANIGDLPLYAFSHQEGHLAAGLPSQHLTKPFLAVHLSGGTTEILKVTPSEAAAGFTIDLLSSTTDLSAGQMVDRVGVALGLPFPAGQALESLAQKAEGRLSLASAPAADGNLSFSGPCSAALRLINAQENAAEVAFATLRVIANALEKSLRVVAAASNLHDVLFVGGVMSNQLIRQRLQHRFGSSLNLIFTEAQLCTDNAVGIALLARSQSAIAKKDGSLL